MDAIFIDETRHDPMFEPTDWEVMEPLTFVRHLATGLIFQVYPNPAREPEDQLAFSEFFAHLAHNCTRQARRRRRSSSSLVGKPSAWCCSRWDMSPSAIQQGKMHSSPNGSYQGVY